MLYRITLPAALAATLAFGSLPATAAVQPQETPADLSAFRTAKVSLEQAVKTVQDDTDGIVTSAAFHATPVVGPKPPYAAAEVIGRAEGYLVTFIAAGAMNLTYVDPQTGRAAQIATEGTADYNPQGINQPDYLAPKQPSAALVQAIDLAEQRTGGRAIDAALARHDGALGYRVGVVRNGTISNEWVNPGSGQVVAVR